MQPFGERVVTAVERTGPLCCGIDPSAALLGAWGLPDDAGGLQSFVTRCVEAFAGVVPVVKPQVAFFERHGAAGIAVLERLLEEAAGAGLLVVADAKRGDVGSTSQAYADAWLGEGSPLAADAVTAHPYLGLGSLGPLVAAARRNGRGLLVVARSSNPEGRALQESVGADRQSVGDAILRGVAELNAEELRTRGRTAPVAPVAPAAPVAQIAPVAPVASVGAVVGATCAPSAASLGSVGGVLLAPGVGAQGATAADVGALFAGCPRGTVLPAISRAVLAAGPDAGALRAAAVLAREEMAAALM